MRRSLRRPGGPPGGRLGPGVLLAAGVLLAGCVSVQRESHDPLLAAGIPGHPYERLLRTVVLDETDRAEVLALLGPPHSVTVSPTGSELLRWDAPVRTRTRVTALPLLDVDLAGERITSVHVEIAAGAVRRYWLEED